MINGKLKRGTTLNGSVRASNAEPAEEIFWCVRSATTYTEISNAIAANKLPMLYIPATREMYVYYSSSEYEHKFFRYSEINECFWIVGCRNTDSWYTTSYYYQPKLTFDGTPRLGSNNPVRSHGIYNAIEAAKVTVDSELSSTSDNPVANKVIKAALDSLGEANLLIAEYGVTTISELEAAYQGGKQILCVRNGIIYPMLLREDNNTYQVFRFGLAFENEYRYLICNDGNSGQWSTTYVDYRDAGGGTPYDSNPAMDGTASAGSSDEYARGDHVHPTDTSRAAASEITRIEAAVAGKADQASIQQTIEDTVDDWLTAQAPSIGTLSYAAKQALLACFRKVAWIDDQGQSYYNALESELFPDATLESITAVFTQGDNVIYDTDSLDTLKQYLTVTATYADSTTATVIDYELSGTLTAGTSTITVSYGGKTTTFNATVTHYSGALVQGTHTFSNGSYVTVRGNHVKVYCSVAYNGDTGYQFNYLDINDNTANALTSTANANNKTSKFTIPSNTQCTFAINNISANGVYVKNTSNKQTLVFGNRKANETSSAGSDTIFGSNTTFTQTTNGYPTGSYTRNFTLSSTTNIGSLYVYFGHAAANGTMEFDVEFAIDGTPIV